MRIVRLQTENIKRIKVAEVTPEGDLISIGGRNENGKSSLIDSIEYGLHGGKSLPAEPLRRGQKKGKVTIDLGELTVERIFTKKGSTLTVTPKDGLPFPSPQSVLDKLYADHTFDPLGFMGLKKQEKRAFLQRILDLDFTALDVERLRLYSERTAINREAKNLEAQAGSIEPDEDVTEISTSDLLAQIEKGEQHNASIRPIRTDLVLAQGKAEFAKSARERYEAELESLRQRAATLKDLIAKEQEQENILAARVAEMAEEIEGFEPINVDDLKAQLQRAGEINQKVQEQVWRKNIDSQSRAKNGEAMSLTLAIEAIDAQKERAIADAKFPVEGLSFSEDGVLFNDLPFEQASGEQQIIVSAAMALAQNPQLRILLIRNGSLLDQKHRAILAQWASENDCQVWLEIVSEDGVGCSVVISDGLVVGEASGK